MRAPRWHGKHDIRCDTVPDPEIEQPRDAILKVSSCAICGSDLHLFDGFMPGMEAHVTRSIDSMVDRAKQAVMLETDRPHVPREMIYGCRPGGALMNKGLTLRTGQTRVARRTDDLLMPMQDGQIDLSFVITHTVPPERGPEMYKTSADKTDGCIKRVLKPQLEAA